MNQKKKHKKRNPLTFGASGFAPPQSYELQISQNGQRLIDIPLSVERRTWDTLTEGAAESTAAFIYGLLMNPEEESFRAAVTEFLGQESVDSLCATSKDLGMPDMLDLTCILKVIAKSGRKERVTKFQVYDLDAPLPQGLNPLRFDVAEKILRMG